MDIQTRSTQAGTAFSNGVLGVAITEHFFSKNNWIFREQTIHDWGIDAHVEPKKDDRPVGQLVAIQIKSGSSWFSSENASGIRHSVSDWHMEYWLRHQLPVFIILHDPESNTTIWQKIERHLLKRSKKGRWSIRIPRSNILDKGALPFFEKSLGSDPTSFRRNHLALDYPLMVTVRDADEAFLQVVEMNHKSLNMRGAWFRFNDESKSTPDLAVERWLPHSDIHDYMVWAFPWLSYEHTTELEDETGSIEAETHKLIVELSAIGKAFLELEAFYKDGATPKEYELIFEEGDEMDEDEYLEWSFQRAIEEE